MAPTDASAVVPAMTRTRVRTRRREPTPLDQIPAWRELVPVMDPALTTGGRSDGMEALLGGLNGGPAQGS